MTRSFKTEAFVLRKKNLLNKDILVILFTKSNGKLPVIAKGVKKLTSRRSPHLQTGNLINVHLHKKGERIYLEETGLISGFSELKKSRDKITDMYRFFYVLEKLLPENQSEDIVYNLTISYLIELSQSITKNILIYKYFNRLLRSLGYVSEDHDETETEAIISDLINEKLPVFNI